MFSKAVRSGESGESRYYREQVSGIARDRDESGREGSNDRHGARGLDPLPEKPRGQDQRVSKPAVVHAYCPAQRIRHPGPPAPTNGTHSRGTYGAPDGDRRGGAAHDAGGHAYAPPVAKQSEGYLPRGHGVGVEPRAGCVSAGHGEPAEE